MADRFMLVIDVGATNVRAIIVDERGVIRASGSVRNSVKVLKGNFKIWDVDELWQKIRSCARQAVAQVKPGQVSGVVVSTFGADGSFFDKSGKMLYPVISWQCDRTKKVMDEIGKVIQMEKLYAITGQQSMPFNTFYRFLWMKENQPSILAKADKFMMLPGLLSWKMTGEMSISSIDPSTMMMMDVRKREWSDRLLGLVGKDQTFFPKMYSPGEKIGNLTATCVADFGLSASVPVFAGGHDTTLAVLGSGVGINEPVLSSGTWEVLLVRTKECSTEKRFLDDGMNVEFDVRKDLYNPSVQWLASGVLEWVRDRFYSVEKDSKDIYSKMISEAEVVRPPHPVSLMPQFVPGFGVWKKRGFSGEIRGLTMASPRGAIYRAALEGMSFLLKDSLAVLEKNAGFKTRKLKVIGGGSKNPLWNRIKASVLGIPVLTGQQQECTVLGAAMAGFVGAGQFRNLEEAAKGFKDRMVTVEPETKITKAYQEQYECYKNTYFN